MFVRSLRHHFKHDKRLSVQTEPKTIFPLAFNRSMHWSVIPCPFLLPSLPAITTLRCRFPDSVPRLISSDQSVRAACEWPSAMTLMLPLSFVVFWSCIGHASVNHVHV